MHPFRPSLFPDNTLIAHEAAMIGVEKQNRNKIDPNKFMNLSLSSVQRVIVTRKREKEAENCLQSFLSRRQHLRTLRCRLLRLLNLLDTNQEV